MKKSQLDTEIDENPKIFQFSKFFAVFLKNFQQTPEIGMLKKGQQGTNVVPYA